ncbi:penicillin-binding protein 2 [Gemmobacter fulvus]|uniref:Penicillin-binding protein 2 n=1 Tax=Gemmobacter fulvus TaxID=2840474 RepID=A0A975S2I5_9RHOB|nr:penicillin-binding protein 2 [Gemmobacter fulvus]MBT9244586.1 penicillin-binding protein 2 [Gemmobacter fulvus]MDQ1848884.1 penicillin-binding protein 2 [Gemmobacter fulvus]QWK91446.1 penicillin-binding protein 2 [Gemmobacter fulvus]
MRRTARDTEESARMIRRRAFLLGGAMSAFVAVLGARMRYLQVDQADEFRLLAEENRINIRLIPPARGLIQDRNGKLIAGNEQNYRVVITREDAGDVDLVMQRLAQIVPLSPEDIEKTLQEVERRSPFVPITVADRLSWEDFSKIALNAPSLPGVTPEVGLSRAYPLDSDFAHIVGYVGPVSEKDLEGLENPDPVLQIPKFQIGKIGVERWTEDKLRGKAGQKRIEVNSVGRVMRELERQEGVPGADLRLTIDADIQNFVQVRLGDESAAVVAMDVESGDILAIASAPSFDPNLFVRGISQADYSTLTENDHRPLANKCVQGAYPPGSTFKMVTALAALQAGVINSGTGVYCPGHYEMGGRRFHCWKRGGHGTVSLNSALAESCDVYFYDIAQRVGIDKIAEMGRHLGLGMRHDLPMSAITEGVMPDKAWKQQRYGQEWRIGDTINASIGQGYVLTSPLQLAVMTARLASGRAVVPRLLHMIDNEPLPLAEQPVLPVDPAYLEAARRGMFEVMNGQRGTAKSSRIADDSMLMAGKTGTAQVRNISAAERASGVVSNDQLPWERRDHALFVCFAPYDRPKVAVSVVVEHGGGGSTVAAPIARDVLLRCLTGGIPPLTAYPSAQRGRIETQFKEMKLRDTGVAAPAKSRA